MTAARPSCSGPRARADYPSSLSQFLDWFRTDADCAAYLASSLAGPLLLPELRAERRLADEAASLRVRRVRQADLDHGRDDLREDAAAAADVVPRDLDADEQQERRQREGAGARELGSATSRRG